MTSNNKLNCAVVGASSGIGKAVAELLAQKGNTVYGFSRRYNTKPQSQEGPIIKLGLDVTAASAVEEAFDGLDSLNVLVYSAGGAVFSEAMDTTSMDLESMWKVHVSGTWNCLKHALPKLVSNASNIVVIGSIAGTSHRPGCMAYSAAKTAQRVLCQNLESPCRDQGTRMTYMALGAVDTPLWNNMKSVSRNGMLAVHDIAKSIVSLIEQDSMHVPCMTILPNKGIL